MTEPKSRPPIVYVLLTLTAAFSLYLAWNEIFPPQLSESEDAVQSLEESIRKIDETRQQNQQTP